MKTRLLLSSILLITATTGVILTPTPSLEGTQKTFPPAIVEVITPGQDPKQPLRIKAIPKSQQNLLISSTEDDSTFMAGQAAPKIVLPITQITMQIIVSQVDANGDIHYLIKITNLKFIPQANTSPDVIKILQQKLAGLVGIQARQVIDSRGQVKAFDYDLSRSTNKKMAAQIFESIQNPDPFPAIPMGLGASWRVIKPATESGGIRLKTINTYTLKSLKNGQAELGFKIEQNGGKQEISDSVFSSDIKMLLVSYQAKGEGQESMNLKTGFVEKSSTNIKAANQLELQSPESAEKIPVNIQSIIKVKMQGQ